MGESPASKLPETSEPPETSELSEWLQAGLAQPPTRTSVECAGLTIHLRQWGTPGRPGLVLVHGGSANSSWWDHIAPWLATEHHVVAVDLSGHGDSSWRPEAYTLAGWADEVLAVVDALPSTPSRPVLIGHSMGGLVCLRAGMRAEARLGGLVVLDVGARRRNPAERERMLRRAASPGRTFGTKDEAVGEFQTTPADPAGRHIPSIVRHIAAASVRCVEGGWRWKTDRRIFLRDELGLDDLRELSIPVCLIGAENGLLGEARAAEMVKRLGDAASFMSIPLAGHHLMLDQPVALVATLRAVLVAWQRSGKPAPAA